MKSLPAPALVAAEPALNPTPGAPAGGPTPPGFWRRYGRNKGAVAGLALLVVVAVVALFGPALAPNDPWGMVQQPFLHPGAEPGLALGTDTLGRDVLSGLIFGARISLLIGVVSTFCPRCCSAWRSARSPAISAVGSMPC